MLNARHKAEDTVAEKTGEICVSWNILMEAVVQTASQGVTTAGSSKRKRGVMQRLEQGGTILPGMSRDGHPPLRGTNCFGGSKSEKGRNPIGWFTSHMLTVAGTGSRDKTRS